LPGAWGIDGEILRCAQNDGRVLGKRQHMGNTCNRPYIYRIACISSTLRMR